MSTRLTLVGQGEKAQRVQEYATSKAEMEGDLEQTKVDLAADEQFLTDLKTEANQKSQDFESRQELR